MYITSDAADTQSKDLDEEMKVVMLIAVVIIVAVLLLQDIRRDTGFIDDVRNGGDS